MKRRVNTLELVVMPFLSIASTIFPSLLPSLNTGKHQNTTHHLSLMMLFLQEGQDFLTVTTTVIKCAGYNG